MNRQAFLGWWTTLHVDLGTMHNYQRTQCRSQSYFILYIFLLIIKIINNRIRSSVYSKIECRLTVTRRGHFFILFSAKCFFFLFFFYGKKCQIFLYCFFKRRNTNTTTILVAYKYNQLLNQRANQGQTPKQGHAIYSKPQHEPFECGSATYESVTMGT